MYPMFLSTPTGFGTLCLDCEKLRREPQPGDYIVVYWSDGVDHQSAAGFFDHRGWWLAGDGHIWWTLDWGYSVDTSFDNFRWERAEPPAGESYSPIDKRND